MKYLNLLLFGMVVSSNCTYIKGKEVFKYDEYYLNNKLEKKNAVVQIYKKLNDTVSELTIVKNNTYKRVIIIKKIKDKIYWKCNGKFILSHSLSIKDTLRSCYSEPPFLNKTAKINGEKTYLVENKKYTVYSYGESNGSESDVATYFMKDFGFICYYDIPNKNYYFLSDYSGVDNSISPDLGLLRKLLTSDTSFFINYLDKMPKPNFPK